MAEKGAALQIDQGKSKSKEKGLEFDEKAKSNPNVGENTNANDEGLEEAALEIDEIGKKKKNKEAIEKAPDRPKAPIEGGDLIDMLFREFLKGVNNVTDTVLKYAIDKPFDMTIGALAQKLVRNLDKKGTKEDLEEKAAKRKENDVKNQIKKNEKKYGFDGTTTYYEDVNKHKNTLLKGIKGVKNGQFNAEDKLRAAAIGMASAELISEKCNNPSSHRDYMQSPSEVQKRAGNLYQKEVREAKFEQELGKLNMKGMSLDDKKRAAYNLHMQAMSGKLDKVKLDANGEKILEAKANKLSKRAGKATDAVNKRISSGKYEGKDLKPKLPKQKDEKQTANDSKTSPEKLKDAATKDDVQAAADKVRPTLTNISNKANDNKRSRKANVAKRTHLNRIVAGKANNSPNRPNTLGRKNQNGGYGV